MELIFFYQPEQPLNSKQAFSGNLGFLGTQFKNHCFKRK